MQSISTMYIVHVQISMHCANEQKKTFFFVQKKKENNPNEQIKNEKKIVKN